MLKKNSKTPNKGILIMKLKEPNLLMNLKQFNYKYNKYK